jgi:hypothetical protein
MATQVHRQEESAEVAAWRRDQLEHSGFPHTLAVQVAGDGRYDLHALIELVERRCPPHLAVRILAPLQEPDTGMTLLPSAPGQ